MQATGTETGRWANNRAEHSHLPFRRRERAMLRFRRMRSLQKFAAVHASVSNHFNQERSLSSRKVFKTNRAAALTEWRDLCAEQGAVRLSWLRLVRISLPAPGPAPTDLPSRPGSRDRYPWSCAPIVRSPECRARLRCRLSMLPRPVRQGTNHRRDTACRFCRAQDSARAAR